MMSCDFRISKNSRQKGRRIQLRSYDIVRRPFHEFHPSETPETYNVHQYKLPSLLIPYYLSFQVLRGSQSQQPKTTTTCSTKILILQQRIIKHHPVAPSSEVHNSITHCYLRPIPRSRKIGELVINRQARTEQQERECTH